MTQPDPDQFVHVTDGVRGAPLLTLSPQLTALPSDKGVAALRTTAESLFAEHGRVELLVDAEQSGLRRIASRSGFRQEGVLRLPGGGSQILFARLRDDDVLGSQEAFTHVLNSTLPRKRLIAQGLVRDDQGRILLCELTYKRFWDLPGGVVDPDEPPAYSVEREIGEELDVTARAARLAAVAWLPRWLGWDDATLLIFQTLLPDGVEHAHLLPREIRAIHWVAPQDLAAHVAPYTVQVVEAALRALDEDSGAAYLEAGPRPS